MSIVEDFLHGFYDTLNTLSDTDFEDIVYGNDLTIEEIDQTLDHMANYLEGNNNE